MHVLRVNCGSSTLKYRLLDLSHEVETVITTRRLTRDIVDQIGEPAATLELALGAETHTPPEPIQGTVQALNTGAETTCKLGFLGQGNKLPSDGQLFVTQCMGINVLGETARALTMPREEILQPDELAALDRKRSPEGVVFYPDRVDLWIM